jgi:hypothetical protein
VIPLSASAIRIQGTIYEQRVAFSKNGSTRWVLLVGAYALKFPAMWEWKTFLWGLLANIQEREFSVMGREGKESVWERLCPLKFSLPLGFLNVAARAVPLTDREFELFDYESFVTVDDNWRIPAEAKSSSFGWVDGRIVAIDYGS